MWLSDPLPMLLSYKPNNWIFVKRLINFRKATQLKQNMRFVNRWNCQNIHNHRLLTPAPLLISELSGHPPPQIVNPNALPPSLPPKNGNYRRIHNHRLLTQMPPLPMSQNKFRNCRGIFNHCLYPSAPPLHFPKQISDWEVVCVDFSTTLAGWLAG